MYGQRWSDNNINNNNNNVLYNYKPQVREFYFEPGKIDISFFLNCCYKYALDKRGDGIQISNPSTSC